MYWTLAALPKYTPKLGLAYLETLAQCYLTLVCIISSEFSSANHLWRILAARTIFASDWCAIGYKQLQLFSKSILIFNYFYLHTGITVLDWRPVLAIGATIEPIYLFQEFTPTTQLFIY